MKFTKQDLKDSLIDESDRIKIVKDEIVDNGRWSIHHTMVFKDSTTGKFYETNYSVGATEYQDERPFEHEPEEIECEEVFPMPVTTIQYFTQEQLDKIVNEPLRK